MKKKEIAGFLQDLTAVPGLPGFEDEAADMIAEGFSAYCREVSRDGLGNVFARLGGKGPRVMVAAHVDALGLLVRSVEADGFLGIASLGGFDARSLLCAEVTVHGREGDYYGVIGAKPPHVLSHEDMEKSLPITDLFVDVGLSAERAAQLISPGDLISLNAPFRKLMGNVISSRALDDRAGAAVLLDAMSRLSQQNCHADVFFCLTTQEEVGSRGARMSAFRLQPNLAVAIDVTHAHMNGVPELRTVPYDRPAIGVSPVLDDRLQRQMELVARTLDIPYSREVMPGLTSTDADVIAIARSGVPTALISVPLKYMHTTVECIRLDAVKRTGKLLAGFLENINDRWREWPCG